MINIGLDFGTTNSIISYYNQERKALECFRVTADSNPYIPTAISYDSRGNMIGEAAKEKLGNPEAYSHFKLLLGKVFDEKMPGQEKTVHTVARDYLQTLLETLRNSGNEIGKIVMTIPEAWYQKREQSRVSENLQKIFEEIHVSNVQFQSEPVAAAAYFCWMYQNQQPKETSERNAYEGNLLIIDYGGGTLDVTLCNSVPEKGIHVVESHGFGEEQGPEGCAGSAYDNEVVRILCKEYGLELNDSRFMIVKNELERKLITYADKCSTILEEYYEYPAGVADEEVFTLDLLEGKAVCCKHLIQAFEQVNRPVLEKAIRKLQESTGISKGNLQVVMVGGFSNFYCVEATVRKLLGSRVGAADIRFSGLLNQENKALAVAKGAALIADNVIRVTLKTQAELGIVVYGKPENSAFITKIHVPLIREDCYPDDYENPVYYTEPIRLMPKGAPKIRINLYLGSEGSRTVFATEKTLGEILGSEDRCEGRYQIGMKIDDEGNVLLCLKAEDGKEYRSLVENIPGDFL